MKSLIIGGNGFIGSHLVDKCLQEGDELSVLDLYPERYREPIKRVKYFRASILDIKQVKEALKGVDVVYYLANTSLPNDGGNALIRDIQKDLIPFISFLDEMCDAGSPKLVYYSSGGAVYGNIEANPVSEDHSTNPISPYGILKLAMEKYISFYTNTRGLPSLILRPSNPYGIRQGHVSMQGVITTFLYKVLTGEKLSVWGDGTNTKDYLMVEDLATITYNLVQNKCVGIYNVGSGNGTSVLDILDVIKKVTGKDFSVEFISQKQTDVQNIILDNAKMLRAQDCIPNLNMSEGIHNIWMWMQTVFK